MKELFEATANIIEVDVVSDPYDYLLLMSALSRWNLLEKEKDACYYEASFIEGLLIKKEKRDDLLSMDVELFYLVIKKVEKTNATTEYCDVILEYT